MTRRLLILFLIIASLFVLSSCMKESNYYSKLEIDPMIIKLDKAVKAAESETTAAIEKLKTDYELALAVLEKTSSDNKKNIDILKEEYTKLVAADSANTAAITECAAKIAALETEAKTIAESIAKLEEEFNLNVENVTRAHSDRIAALEAALIGYIPVRVHTVSFDSNGGAEVPSQSVETLGAVEMPEVSTKIHYDFEGWYVGEDKWGFSKDFVVRDINLVAKWTPTVYNIDLVFNNGSAQDTVAYTIESADITLPVPTRLGYTFVGWLSEGGEVPMENVTIPAGSYGDKTYTAVWQGNEIEISFAANNGSAIYTETLIAGDPLPTPVRTESIFLSWYKDSDLTEEISVVPAESTTLYAAWESETNTSYFEYEIIDDEGEEYVKIIGLRKFNEKIVIPRYIENLPVKVVGRWAFRDYNITSIKFTENIELIETEAFLDCFALKRVIFTGGIKEIENYAFFNCEAITTVYYSLSESDWALIDLSADGNEYILNATIKYNSEVKGDSIIEGDDLMGDYNPW